MEENHERRGKVPFWPIMIAIFFGNFVSVLSTTTINIAVPLLMNHFHTGLHTMQWMVTGFMLATGVTAPLAGYLGGRFSYKRLYLFALSGFTLFSLLCAVSGNPLMLIIFRMLQGSCSGLIMACTMTIIFQVIPIERRPFAVSLWSLSAMVAPAIGPTFSGWLLQYASWHWLFLINIPVGLVAIILTQLLIPYYRMNVPKSFDVPGLITVVTGSLALLTAFSQGSSWGWGSWRTLLLIAAGIVLLLLFVLHELRTEVPLLNLRVFQNRRFTAMLCIYSLVTVAMYAGTYLTPLFLQTVQGATTLKTGLILLPSSILLALLSPVVGKLYPKFGPVKLISAGIAFIFAGLFMLSRLHVDVSHNFILWAMVVRNLGIGLANVPSSTASMEEIPVEWSGHATSINNWVRNVLSSLAIAVFTSLLSSRSVIHSKELFESGAAGSDSITLLSFTMGVNDVFVVAAIIVLFGFPLMLLLRRKGGTTPLQMQTHVRKIANQ
ncbi:MULTISPECIES: MDR family MFS transporter [Paenibacillus]|uniref:MFS transporter n=1 Tax=Paenibacillus borealis TaxID=160799 RepID=A0ABX3HJC5_PAEBO|nr:MDR family MFS transporter [Paenibacillus borealis]OMD50717.1 MFS transporter [Paenibacillus borealis]